MSAKKSHTRNFSFILAVTLLFAGSYLLAADTVRSNPERGRTSNAADKGSVPVEPRFRVFALKHIPVEQAKEFLAEAKLGTVSQLPAANMILVTAQPRQLIKASAILKLIDTDTPFVMKAIFPASAAGDMPLNEQIAAEVGNIAIGSFSNPPSGIGKAKAIIDVHDDSVVAIAPADRLETIIEAIGKYASDNGIQKLQEVKAEDVQPAQPKTDQIADAEIERVKAEFQKIKAELNGKSISFEYKQTGTYTKASEPKGLFDKLLDSLAEAEKKLDELAQPVPGGPESNEPPIQSVTVVAPTEKSEPNEPSVALEQAKETAVEAAKPPEKPELDTAPEKPVAEKIVTKLPSKRDVNAVPEQVAVEVEEPNKVAPILREEPNMVTKVVEPNAAIQPYRPELAEFGDDKLVLDLPAKINIIDLLDLVGKYLGLDYMYDPADVTGLKGEVHLVIQRPIKVRDLYPLAESVLKFKGFVMTRRTNIVTIVPAIKALEIDAPIVDPDKPGIQTGDVIITCIFHLEYIDTASAQNLLTGMKLGLSFSPIPEMGILIVSEYAYRMERVEELIKMIDVPGEPRMFKSRPLQYTMAKTLAAKVKTLAEQLGTVSISIVATPGAPAAQSTARLPGESTTAYQRRLQAIRAAAARRTPAPTAPAKGPAESAVYLDADERTNRILMIGLKSQLEIVDELIDALDVEQKDLRTLRLYEVQHVDAEDVRNKLGEIGIISGVQATSTSGRTVSRAQTRTPPPRPTPGAPPSTGITATTAIEEPLTEEPQVVIIEPTNSLLVNATAEQHVQIAMIIGYVDSTQEEAANPYVIYPLENQDPEELAGVLEKLIQETITEQGGADSKVPRTTIRKKIEEDIFIVPDPKSYSLIVYASKKNQQWIASLIKELDQYRPQVLLDVTLVEITKNDEFNYDLNFISSFPDLVNISGLTGVIAGGDSPITSSDIIAKLDSKNMDRFIDMQASGGTGTAFYGDRHINILLNAMQSKDYGRILARPKLLVNDNEQGNIKAQETTSVGSPKTTYRKGSGGGTVVEDIPITDISWASYEAGIQLDIQPHISKGDQLRLTITLTRTDFRLRPATTISGATYPTPPDLLTSDVQTVVTVPDNKTIILGGLERISQSKGGSKVPILGDIPLLGGFFRNAANTDSQSRLYVFVKAHILRPGEEATGVSDLQVVSLKNRATFEKYEKEMQEYEDWPGIKPKPMEPKQILEADEAASLQSRQVFEEYEKEKQKNGYKMTTKPKTMGPKEVHKSEEAVSLKDRKVIEEHKKETRKYEVRTAPKLMHPMRILEPD